MVIRSLSLLGRLALARGRRWDHGLAFAVLLAWLLLGLVTPWLPYDAVADVHPYRASEWPSLIAPLGTDHLGRDVLRRLALGSKAFVVPGAFALLSSLVLGLPLGIAGGLLDGLAAALARAPLAIIDAVPRIVFVLLVCTVFGDSPAWMGCAAGVAWAPTVAAGLTQRCQAWRATERMLALRAHGVSTAEIVIVHIVLGANGAWLARQLVSLLGFVLLLETALSYLGGFGVQEPQPSWGNMLAFDWGYWSNPLGALAPALALWSAAWASHHLAEAFREVARG